MNDDELGRLLSDAFDAQARGSVGDAQPPPPPRFASPDLSRPDVDVLADPFAGGTRSRRFGARVALPLSAAAAVVVLVGLVLAFVGHGSGTPRPHDSALGASPSVHAVNRSALRGSGAPVHIKLLNSDHSLVGVGMPVIAYLSRRITDGRALQDLTTVTVDGTPATAAWYVEPSTALKGYPYEAHLRPQNYWPAHASVHVGVDTAGMTAGTGLRFDDSVSLDFRTGARHVVLVNARTNRLTLVSDGVHLDYPVSLGSFATPTTRGIKVIMEKGANICMSGPGYDVCGIKYTQRLTYDGEYLHAAPWNVVNIKDGVDSSNGCTNMLPAQAKHLFAILRVGDLVDYPNADGPRMQLGSGFGDWNVSWKQWLTGGLVRTH